MVVVVEVVVVVLVLVLVVLVVVVDVVVVVVEIVVAVVVVVVIVTEVLEHSRTTVQYTTPCRFWSCTERNLRDLTGSCCLLTSLLSLNQYGTKLDRSPGNRCSGQPRAGCGPVPNQIVQDLRATIAYWLGAFMNEILKKSRARTCTEPNFTDLTGSSCSRHLLVR